MRILIPAGVVLFAALWILSLFRPPSDNRPRWPDGTLDTRTPAQVNTEIMKDIATRRKEERQLRCDYMRNNPVDILMEKKSHELGYKNSTEQICDLVSKPQ